MYALDKFLNNVAQVSGDSRPLVYTRIQSYTYIGLTGNNTVSQCLEACFYATGREQMKDILTHGVHLWDILQRVTLKTQYSEHKLQSNTGFVTQHHSCRCSCDS